MLKRRLKHSLQLVKSNKTISLVNIIGLAISLSICLVIGAYLHKEYSFDRYHTKGDNVYRLLWSRANQFEQKAYTSNSDYRIKDILINEFPEVESACFFDVKTGEWRASFKIDSATYRLIYAETDNSFNTIFSVETLEGNAQQLFLDFNSAVITASTAKKLFGDESPLGKTVEKTSTNKQYIITAVIEDFPERSSIQVDILFNPDRTILGKYGHIRYGGGLRANISPIYIHFKAFTDKESFKEQLEKDYGYTKERGYVNGMWTEEKVELLALYRMHLHDISDEKHTIKGNVGLLRILLAIGIAILLLSLSNYINLILARISRQTKEMSIRKVVGASMKHIWGDLFFDITFISFSALIIAFFISVLLLPFYNNILNININTIDIFDSKFIFVGALGLLLLSMILSLLPAKMISSLLAAKAISGNIKNKKQDRPKALLFIFQLCISIVLITSVFFIQKQISSVTQRDMGYHTESMYFLNTPESSQLYKSPDNGGNFKQEILRSPYINKASITNFGPGFSKRLSGHATTAQNINTEERFAYDMIDGDIDLLHHLGLEIVERSNEYGQTPYGVYYSESMVKAIGWETILQKKHRVNGYINGKRDSKGKLKPILGIVKDIELDAGNIDKRPFVINIAQPDRFRTNSMMVLIDNNHREEAFEYYQNLYLEQSNYDRKALSSLKIINSFEDWMIAQYVEEQQLSKTIQFFAIIAILLSCMGIFSYVISMATTRTKEIGIRKVNGATISEILLMLNKDFIKWVAIAFVIAVPIAYYAMSKWLENFAYKTELSWWIFALAGVLALGIALLTVSWQSWRAARRNPIESLRYE